MPLPSGTEKMIGFVPITRVFPPGAATIGGAFVNLMPMQPAAAIWPVK